MRFQTVHLLDIFFIEFSFSKINFDDFLIFSLQSTHMTVEVISNFPSLLFLLNLTLRNLNFVLLLSIHLSIYLSLLLSLSRSFGKRHTSSHFEGNSFRSFGKDADEFFWVVGLEKDVRREREKERERENESGNVFL